jgi:phosphoribosyl 1,2-cyclic phosphodiesterase
LKLTKETLRGKLVFLGTAGARFVAFGFEKQAGGLYFGFSDFNLHVDPGPGAFVHCHRKGIEPFWTDAVFLSHRHLDHCADVNSILEAMTLGGKKKKGILMCPSDCIDDDPVVLKYTRQNIEETVILKEGFERKFSRVRLKSPLKHVHGVETYGLIAEWNGKKFGYISDTKFFEKLIEGYAEAKEWLVKRTSSSLVTLKMRLLLYGQMDMIQRNI